MHPGASELAIAAAKVHFPQAWSMRHSHANSSSGQERIAFPALRRFVFARAMAAQKRKVRCAAAEP